MIDFDSMRSSQRKERNTVSITNISEDFYKDTASYISSLINGSKDLEKIRLLENTVKVARDISYRRMQKIVARAIKTVKTGDYSDKYLTQEEKVLYDKLIDLLKEYTSFVDKVLAGEYKPVAVKHEEKVKEMLINEDEQNIVLARVIKPIPRFVAPDGNEYGPYLQDDVIKLPSSIAEVLNAQGLLELL